MPALWRIATDTADYGSDDLSGKGAEVTGGRWNRKGVPMIYASSSIALACLETLVHLGGGHALPLNRYLVRIDVPDEPWASRTVFDATAHVGWDAEPPGLVSLDWGTQWAQGVAALLSAVPSIVVPEESNVLINPRHSDVAQITAVKVRKWTYDLRLG
jgi:RES domain-containing protein